MVWHDLRKAKTVSVQELLVGLNQTIDKNYQILSDKYDVLKKSHNSQDRLLSALQDFLMSLYQNHKNDFTETESVDVCKMINRIIRSLQ